MFWVIDYLGCPFGALSRVVGFGFLCFDVRQLGSQGCGFAVFLVSVL